MNLENPKLKKLAEEYPLVQELIDELESYQTDPQKVFYLELKEMVVALSSEMKSVRNPINNDEDIKKLCPILKGDDKLFERIKSLMTDSEKIFNGLKKGAAEEEEPQKKGKLKDSKQVAV